LPLVATLSAEEDEEIKELVEPLWEPYRRWAESLKEGAQQQLDKLRRHSADSMKRLMAHFGQESLEATPDEMRKVAAESMQRWTSQFGLQTLEPALDAIRRLQAESMRTWTSQFREVHRALEALTAVKIDWTSRDYLDIISRIAVRNDEFFRSLARMPPSYFPPEPKPAALAVEEHLLVARLRSLEPGQATWRDYQCLCEEILS